MFLDASKAFDRVDYCVLFRKLVSRNGPSYIVRLLWNWCSRHFAQIQWAGVLSDNFSICNGVRQGGILSPFLFGIYFKEMSLQPQTKRIGCRLGNMIINHLLFRDDAVAFAPSAKCRLSLSSFRGR